MKIKNMLQDMYEPHIHIPLVQAFTVGPTVKPFFEVGDHVSISKSQFINEDFPDR